MKFRHQFIFSFILLEAIFILLIVVFNTQTLKNTSQNLVSQQIENSMDLLSEIVKTPILVGDLATLDDATQNFVSFKHMIAVQVFDAHQRLMSSAAQQKSKTTDNFSYFEYKRGLPLPEKETLIQVSYPIKLGNDVIGSVRFLYDNEEAVAEIRHARVVSFSLAAFSILIGILVAFTMGERITRTLQKLIQSAQFIARGKDVIIPKRIVQKNDELAHLAIAMNDMQEQIKLRTNSLIAAEQKALQANKAKSEFLSSMSHELRTPLNAVIGFSQLLGMDELGKDQREYVDEINKAANHLLDLINEILDFEKIEAGKVDLHIQEVDVDSLLDECHSMIQPLAKPKQIELRFSDQALNIQLEADRMRLKQSLVNLLSNAVKYNDDHGHVEITCHIENDQAIFNIKDSGSGINEEAQQHLFEPFNRLGQEAGSIEGSGIGLSITKNLIELMHGSIEYQDNQPKGSRFIVKLPLKQP